MEKSRWIAGGALVVVGLLILIAGVFFVTPMLIQVQAVGALIMLVGLLILPVG